MYIYIWTCTNLTYKPFWHDSQCNIHACIHTYIHTHVQREDILIAHINQSGMIRKDICIYMHIIYVFLTWKCTNPTKHTPFSHMIRKASNPSSISIESTVSGGTSDIHTYIHTYMHTYIQTNQVFQLNPPWAGVLQIYIHTYIHAYIHTYKPTKYFNWIHWERGYFRPIEICM
jgi:hypothetical protein